MGKQASRPINIPRSTYHPYRRTTTTTTPSRNTVSGGNRDFEELEEGEIAEDSPAYSRSSSRSFWDTDSGSSYSSNTSYSSSSGFCRSIDRYTPFQDQLRPSSGESQLDYYIRTAPYNYKRYAPISRHSGIVHSPRILESTCAATIPGQKTCVHPSTAPGDIVNYVPMGCPEDVSGDCPGGGKLSMHFMPWSSPKTPSDPARSCVLNRATSISERRMCPISRPSCSTLILAADRSSSTTTSNGPGNGNRTPAWVTTSRLCTRTLCMRSSSLVNPPMASGPAMALSNSF
ncbi:hypothetical protein XPA_001233 [Xanthoria parietina]